MSDVCHIVRLHMPNMHTHTNLTKPMWHKTVNLSIAQQNEI